MTKALLLSLALLMSAPAFGQSEPTEQQIKTWALEAILENPEIIMQAVQILEKRQQQAEAHSREQLIKNNYELISADPDAPIMGNPDGDVTVVEFFDYNCSYCRRAFKNLQALVEQDPNVKVLFREFPILSEGSDFAARASLAAMKQGKYVEFHTALMGDDIAPYSISEPIVLDVADRVGLDLDQLRIDMDSAEVINHIATSRELAQALNFNGTPAFVVGTTPADGLLSVDQLMNLVAMTREQNQDG